MGQGNSYPLELVVKAVDQATAPLRAIATQFKSVGKSLEHISHASGMAGLVEGFKGVGEGAHHVFENVKELGLKLLEMEAIGGFALYELVKGSVEAGAKLKEMADRTGLGVNAYAQLQFAAGQAHVNQDEFNAAMDKFNVSMGQAKARSGPLYEFLSKVSPVLAEQIRHTKGTQQGLDLMAKAFQKVEDPSKRAALAQAAFGRGNLKMGQFLGQGSEAIHGLMKQYEGLAGSQEEFAENGEEAEKALNVANAAFAGLRNAAAAQLMPALSELATTIASLVAGNRENIANWARAAGKAIQEWVANDGVGKLVRGFQDFAKTVLVVVDAVGGWKTVAGGAAAIMAGPLLSALVGLGGAVLSLVPALVAMASTLVGAGVALAPFLIAAAPFIAAAAGIAAVGYEIYKNWGDLTSIWSDFWSGPMIEKMTTVWNIVKSIAAALWTIGKWSPPGLLIQGGMALFDHFSNKSDSAQPLANPAAALPGGVPLAAGGQATAKVQVDFVNLPKGTRVNQDRDSTADLDLNLGYNSGFSQ